MIKAVSQKIDRFLGLKLRFHWSSLILIYLITSIFGEMAVQKFQETNIVLVYTASVFITLLVVLSIIAHEMGHVIAGRRNGIGFSSVTIFALGGLAKPTNQFPTPKSELITSVAGPLISFSIATVSLIVFIIATIIIGEGLVTWTLSIIAILNTMMGIFNLIPAFPLDGGRILRATIWMAKGNFLIATKYASYTGQVIGGLMIGYGAISVLTGGGLLNGVWIGIIGFIIITSAKQLYLQALRNRNV
jgi:Zn-dependent protease